MQVQTAIYKTVPFISVTDSKGKITKQVINISFLEAAFEKAGYTRQPIAKALSSTRDIHVFYKFNDAAEVKWKAFLAGVVVDGAELFDIRPRVNESFILLKGNKRDKTFFGITGGLGHIDLGAFLDVEFGQDILARLISSNDKVLRAVKERGFTGGILGSVKFFRGDFNLFENDSFGNFYQELSAFFDRAFLKKEFKFADCELRQGNLCVARESFRIKKAITFRKFLELIDILDAISQRPVKAELNSIVKLDKSQQTLIDSLNTELRKLLVDKYLGKHADSSIELCHKKFDKYYDAASYRVAFFQSKWQHVECDGLSTLEQLYDCYATKVSALTPTEFNRLIESTRIMSFDEDGNELTKDSLIKHCCVEITSKKKSYFLINEDWFFVKDSFVDSINSQCNDLLSHVYLSSFLHKWTSKFKLENDYNAACIALADHLVFDKITPEGIEVCDILRWDKDNVYFIHVKKGFNNQMRDLCRQVHISARKMAEDSKTGWNYTRKLYGYLAKSTGTSPYTIATKKALIKYSESEFIDIISKRQRVFVLAVYHEAKKFVSLKDVKPFRSNIAKFCLARLGQEMKLLDVEFRVAQIER